MLYMPNLNQPKPDTSSVQRHYVMVTIMLEKSLAIGVIWRNGSFKQSSPEAADKSALPGGVWHYDYILLSHNYFEFCS